MDDKRNEKMQKVLDAEDDSDASKIFDGVDTRNQKEDKMLDGSMDSKWKELGSDGKILRYENENENENKNENENGNQDQQQSNKSNEEVKMCVECEDQPAQLKCLACLDVFCAVCYRALHRKGERINHKYETIQNFVTIKKNQVPQITQVEDNEDSSDEEQQRVVNEFGTWFLERSKFIPVRLSLSERKKLRLLEAALNVSEYTDKVDILSYESKSKRIFAQLKEICAILSGLVVASDYQKGQAMIKEKSFVDNQEFFREIFEIGRRHKIMNPTKMRADYGKLLYLLQDSQIPEIKEMMQFSCVNPVKTVYILVEEAGATNLFLDPVIAIATQEIVPEGKSRQQIQKEIKNKEKAVDYLSSKYSNSKLSPDTIKLCLYSIADNHSYLRSNRDPVDKMILYLKQFFSPDKDEDDFSLAISFGMGGARLTHSHRRQYAYVLQSLTLWREISHEMFKLWILAESDLLEEGNYYKLRDTGQGYNRVQYAPRISREMHHILHQTQEKLGEWVGSSVIHLGDHNVPNALTFIDKYTQVSRILTPIISCISKIDEIEDHPHLMKYITSQFKDADNLKKIILCDFFRHAFDGSGADNFFDAGSCIDGRLTSAWNWCSKIEKKSYFPVFLLTGFMGFDGEF